MNYRDLMYAIGGPVSAYAKVDAHRSGIRPDPYISTLTSPAAFDRYTQMAQFGQNFGPNAPFYMRALSPIMGGVGAGLLGINEVSKMVPGAQELMGRIDPSFIPDESTSPPSWGNFEAGMAGLFEGMTPGLLE